MEGSCASCDLSFPDSLPDQIALIYLTTAVQTAALAFIVILAYPSSPWLARGVLALVAIGIMLANLPNRKGFAVAVDYLATRGGSPDS